MQKRDKKTRPAWQRAGHNIPKRNNTTKQRKSRRQHETAAAILSNHLPHVAIKKSRHGAGKQKPVSLPFSASQRALCGVSAIPPEPLPHDDHAAQAVRSSRCCSTPQPDRPARRKLKAIVCDPATAGCLNISEYLFRTSPSRQTRDLD